MDSGAEDRAVAGKRASAGASQTLELRRVVARAGMLAALGLVLFVVAVGFFFYDVSHANRPHELHWVPLVLTLLLANVLAAVFVLRGLRSTWRLRMPGALRVREIFLVILAWSHVGLNLLLVVYFVGLRLFAWLRPLA